MTLLIALLLQFYMGDLNPVTFLATFALWVCHLIFHYNSK